MSVNEEPLAGKESEELELVTPHGSVLRARAWGDPGDPPVLALHGWMDNANSFAPLAGYLEGRRLVALDLPGHGRSDWRPAGSAYHFVDYVRDVTHAVAALGWERFELVGHSMGSSVAALYSAVAPERVERVVFIDGLGPLSTSPEDALDLMKSSIAQRVELASRSPRPSETRDGLVDRMVSARPWITREACDLLVERCARSGADGWFFTHDPVLRASSMLRLTEEHVHAFFAAIEAPTLVIRASKGWPVDEDFFARRLGAIASIEVVVGEGTHHLHMDDPESTARTILDFFSKEDT